MEFQRDWLRHCKKVADQIKYLSLFESSDSILKVFSIEMDATILSDILKCLHSFMLFDEKMEVNEKKRRNMIVLWLSCFPKCGRFHLNVAFLDDNEKALLRSIFDWLHQQLDLSRRQMEKEGLTLNLNDEDEILEMIRQQYPIS